MLMYFENPWILLDNFDSPYLYLDKILCLIFFLFFRFAIVA